MEAQVATLQHNFGMFSIVTTSDQVVAALQQQPQPTAATATAS